MDANAQGDRGARQGAQTRYPKDFLLRTRTGKRYTANGFKSIWRRLQERALKRGIIATRFKFHHLRKKAATDKADLHH